ncbi:hypothetical protein CPHO_05080 [Corynebacterium phocae]|uniref:Uncharacterized protein n=1 Tax=Corynebacterium phocae TaxID=161895 RepID=A0A1L7D2K3_9CORY|nr:hypothetical protein [Corynebacterium phocae]APT92369.1 hypothetical protein CPHO_05080 [Corynebacterium phocae]KAA8724961.1 hypothetical protein F4V58_04615 [Corynebacterium phocae]
MSRAKEITEAVEAERQAAKNLDLGGQLPFFIVALVLFTAFLALPFSATSRGFEVFTGAASISPMEAVFCFASAAAMVMTVVTLMTKRTKIGWIAWMLSGFSFFAAIWAFWALGFSGGAGVGFFVAVLADLVALVGFSLVAMRKSPEQLAAQERVRRVSGQLDEVGDLQQKSRTGYTAGTSANRAPSPIVDDRRAQAAARYKRQQSRGE